MLDIVRQHLPHIAALCEKYGVKQLELFGSAVRGEFDSNSSDLDFLVLYDRKRPLDAAEQYFGLYDDLEALFKRKVDLVDIRGARNPYFIAEALRHREMLYAA